MKDVIQLVDDFEKLMSVVNIYIREAHAVDEHFVLTSNTEAGICVRQPRTLEQRLTVAKTYASTLSAEYHSMWMIQRQMPLRTPTKLVRNDSLLLKFLPSRLFGFRVKDRFSITSEHCEPF